MPRCPNGSEVFRTAEALAIQPQRVLWWLGLSFLTAGCVSEHRTTPVPDFAASPALVSLCREGADIRVANQGEFVTANRTQSSSGQVLLSSQLMPLPPEVQRQFRHLHLLVSPLAEVTLTAVDAAGEVHVFEFPHQFSRCDEQGALVMSMNPTSSYLWAAWGRMTRQLFLWTNSAGGLVLRNAWQEDYYGAVRGTASGDGWAVFAPSSTAASGQVATLSAAASETPPPAKCVDLSGEYAVEAQVIHTDGTLGQGSALDQFFREGIIGAHPANQFQQHGERLVIRQESANGAIELRLLDQADVLVARTIPADQVKCSSGRWLIRGDKRSASPWLLLMASGGLSWENLRMQRTDEGGLLVWVEYRARNLLFLVPITHHQTLFMVFVGFPQAAEDAPAEGSSPLKRLPPSDL